MVAFTEEYLREAHRSSIFHQAEILRSEACGCFFCKATFAPKEIENWIDTHYGKGTTALCPYCYIDAVIGSDSGFPVRDKEFLGSMNRMWFGGAGP